MILSSDSNDALHRAIANENNSSSRSGLLESNMKKLEDVGVLIARILMPVLFITAGWGKN
ncbi:DoxX protein [Salmonella enterica subsp. arizonae]|nr:DoxX protein [Salmonella enterica subsp. arizonae]